LLCINIIPFLGIVTSLLYGCISFFEPKRSFHLPKDLGKLAAEYQTDKALFNEADDKNTNTGIRND